MSQQTLEQFFDNEDEIITEEVDDSTPALGSSISGSLKKAYDKVKSSSKNVYNFYAGKTAQFTPVYKIMITVPLVDRGSSGIKNWQSYRYIIADTSRPSISFVCGKDSPLVGMWIDQSDLTEPDKAILLIENPVRQLTGLLEPDMTTFHQFGVRNWLDVWMGYMPASTKNIISLPDAVGLVSPSQMKNVPMTYPDAFDFGNDSHVFSGPIVSVKREVTAAGDRLQIIGFSPTMILKQTEAQEYNIKRNEPKAQTIKSVIEQVVSDVKPMSNLLMKELTREDINKKFLMGKFPHAMFAGMRKVGDRVEPYAKIRVVPVYPGKMERNRHGFPTYTEQYNDHAEVLPKLNKRTLRRSILGKSTLYDILMGELMSAGVTGLGRMHAFIKYAKSPEAEWSYTDGYGHPGVFIKIGVAHEISGIKKLVVNKIYSPEHHQHLSLGKDCREFDGGIEYGTVFNIRRFIGKTNDSRGQGNVMFFPLDFLTKDEEGQPLFPSLVGPTGALKGPYHKHRKLWNILIQDIELFGPSISPIEKWLWGKDGKAVDLEQPAVANHIAMSMRETYFTGMSGSVFAVGNPNMKPGRVLSIKDERKDIIFNRAMDLASKNSEAVAKLTKSLRSIRGRNEFPGLPWLNIRNMGKSFYIWKVRHYLGVGSGFITKVYYVEERNRAWQKYVDDISGLMQQAFMQSRMTHGGNSRY